MKVAVLMGGTSAEREVSLETGRAIAGALRELGHETVEVDVDSELPLKLSGIKPDAAFMALHGRAGEDGTVQGMLEVMRIPYTGCGVLSSAMTIDKVVTKEILAYHGLPVIEEIVLRRDYSPQEIDQAGAVLGFPVMVKPACEGSSIGVVRVDSRDELERALPDAFGMDERVMLERFIEGRLFTVGILGTERTVLPVIEIITKVGFYDYRAKYQPGFSEYEVPASLDADLTAETQRIALASFDHLFCEGISRIDLMLEEATGRLYVLEVNTIPGMTATSLVPKAAAAMGIAFNDVVATILAGARLKIVLPG
ncbi:MAG: D-alanine--D-alanine ligase [Candidatus Geothermincolia bacterium]